MTSHEAVEAPESKLENEQDGQTMEKDGEKFSNKKGDLRGKMSSSSGSTKDPLSLQGRGTETKNKVGLPQVTELVSNAEDTWKSLQVSQP